MKHVDGDVGKVTKKTRKRKAGTRARRRYRAKRRRQIAALKRAKFQGSEVTQVLPALNPRRNPKPTWSSAQILFAMSGNSFWLNYSNVFQWKDRYFADHTFTPYPPSHHDPENSQLTCWGRVQNRSSKKNEAPNQHCTDEIDDDDEYSDVKEENEEDIEESEDEIEVTEEMMQFLEISMRHRADREKQKQAARELEEKRLETERNTIEKCAPPTEAELNENRRREMTLLYGKDSAMIHGMETALQLNFNRQLSLHNPSYWPIHPFSIHFKGKTQLK